jgi:large subunit ribosomal protein L20
MSRVTKAVPSRKRRKKILKLAKGYRGRAKNCFSVAIQKVEKALTYAYRDRKVRKREFRSIWIVRINAALRMLPDLNMNYSKFINIANAKNVELNRKSLANLATENQELFNKFALSVINK